jgi:hypothetical protein
MLTNLLIALLFLTPDLSQWKVNFSKRWFLLKQVAYYSLGFLLINFFVDYLLLPAHTTYAKGTFVIVILAVITTVRIIKYFSDEFYDGDISPNNHYALIIVPVGVILFISWSALSGTWIATNLYDNTVKTTQVMKSSLESADIADIPTVLEKNAESRALQTMNQVPNFYWYTLGKGSTSSVNGKLVWVFPLEYRETFIDFTRFIIGIGKVAGSIPGYITVSATDENAQAQLNLHHEMIYMPSGTGKYSLERHVRNQYPDIIIEESSLEPDDSGKPFWAVSFGHNAKNYFGVVIDGVILVDPQTGEMKRYNKGEIPDFVDQAQTTASAKAIATWYGEYVHGYWNNAKTGIKTVNGDPIGVFSNGKFSYLVTFVSPNNDTSLIGYGLIDGKNGSMKYYPITDTQISDTKAKKLVESRGDFKIGKDDSSGWVTDGASFYQVYGQPTWVIPVLDKQSDTLVKIAIVNAHATTADDVILANTTKEAFEMYKSALAKNQLAGGEIPTQGSITKVIKGTVNRVNPNQVTISIVGDNTVYLIDAKMNPQATLIEKGDMLEMTVEDVKEPSVAVVKFTNLTYEGQIK